MTPAATHIACMGGWCVRREQCAHHHAQAPQRTVERLCIRGTDGVRQVAASAFQTVLVDVFTGRELHRERQTHHLLEEA